MKSEGLFKDVDKIPADKFVEKEITSANILKVRVGTTGYCGGNSSKGGRTYLAIQDMGSSDIRVKVGDQEFDLMFGAPLEILVGGDTELWTLQRALQFAANELKKVIVREGQ